MVLFHLLVPNFDIHVIAPLLYLLRRPFYFTVTLSQCHDIENTFLLLMSRLMTVSTRGPITVQFYLCFLCISSSIEQRREVSTYALSLTIDTTRALYIDYIIHFTSSVLKYSSTYVGTSFRKNISVSVILLPNSRNSWHPALE